MVTALLCGAPQLPARVWKYKEMESGQKVKHHPCGQEMLGRNAPKPSAVLVQYLVRSGGTAGGIF